MLFSQAFLLGAAQLITTIGAAAGNTGNGSNVGSGTPTSDGFHMSLDFPGPKLRRRARTYITDEGFLTTDQSQAAVYYISNDQLVNSNGELVSTDGIQPFMPFAASLIPGTITKTWTKNGGLQWSDSSFTAGNGAALYCQGSDRVVYLVFVSKPPACEPAVASPVPTASQTASSTSAGLPIPTDPGCDYYGYAVAAEAIIVNQFNGDKNVDIAGVQEDLNFETDIVGNYQFPGQSFLTNAAFYTVVYQGYLKADTSDNYTLTATDANNNIAWVWAGDNAFDLWNLANVNATAILGNSVGNVNMELFAGDSMPVTIVWTNQGGQGVLNINIYKDTAGTLIGDTTGYFFQPVTGDGFSNSGFTPIVPS